MLLLNSLIAHYDLVETVVINFMPPLQNIEFYFRTIILSKPQIPQVFCNIAFFAQGLDYIDFSNRMRT